MAQEIKIRLTSHISSILSSKITKFLKRNLMIYFFISIVLAYVMPEIAESLFNRFLILFFATSLLSLTSILISAYFQFRNKKFDAEVCFTEDEINIKHLNKSLTENRMWDWVEKYQEDDKAFYLLVNQKFSYRELLFVKKTDLTETEINLFKKFLSKIPLITKA
jgi:hypothetical protein